MKYEVKISERYVTYIGGTTLFVTKGGWGWKNTIFSVTQLLNDPVLKTLASFVLKLPEICERWMQRKCNVTYADCVLCEQ